MTHVSRLLLGLGLALVLVPSAARAACEQWEINGEWVVAQNNGWQATFTIWQSGNTLSGTARAVPYKGSDSDKLFGPLSGTINGNSFSFDVKWSPNSIGVYTGGIDGNGHISGVNKDKQHPESATGWHQILVQTATAKCLKVAAAPPAPAPAPAAPSKPFKHLGKRMATLPVVSVIKDVEVYDAPNGAGNKIGDLKAPNKVQLAEACKNNWCHVLGAAVPTGKGWVYDGPDYDSLQ